jgi:hypothetical protein
MKQKSKKKCKHCGYDISIRNPSGFCDHLYYPENCEVCRNMTNPKFIPTSFEYKLKESLERIEKLIYGKSDDLIVGQGWEKVEESLTQELIKAWEEGRKSVKLER